MESYGTVTKTATALCFGAALLSGCSQSSPEVFWAPQQPLHGDAELRRAYLPAADDPRVQSKSVALRTAHPSGAVGLDQAVRFALQNNPQLAAAGYGVAARAADAEQAGRPPNPTAGFSAENFAGPDGGDLFERQTLRLSQVIELNRKRQKRQALASAEQRIAAWEYESLRLEIASGTTKRYIALVAAQQRVGLASENLALAERALGIVDDKIEAGLSPTSERDRAMVRVSLQRIELNRAERKAEAAAAALRAMWGPSAMAQSAEPIEVGGDLVSMVVLPEQTDLAEQLGESPQIQRIDAVANQRQAAVDLARAKATPDPSVGGGVRYFPDADDAAGLFEVSWPLPIRDRNRAGILAARLRLAQVDEDRRTAWASAREQLATAYASAEASGFELKTLDQQTVPAATRAYDSAVNLFEQGQADYLGVLDAQRTLIQVRLQQLAAAEAYHTAVAEIERITGRAIGAGAQ